ncbi:MAG: tetratricopeptide repeat protein [Planctomycetota bacterium]
MNEDESGSFEPEDFESDGQDPSDLAGISTGASFLMRAERYLQMGRHAEAEAAVREGLAQHAQSAELLALLAHVRLAEERHGEAVDTAKEALAIDATHWRASFVLALALTESGRHSEAETVILAALRRDPEDVHYLRAYARLLYRVDKLEKAERVTRAALALDPEDEDSHSTLSLILSAQKRHEEAAHHGAGALRAAPDEDSGYIALAIAAFQSGHPLRARDLLREAVRIDPSTRNAEMFETVDPLTRPGGLPLYWFGHLVDKLPGKQFTVWIVLAGTLRGMRAMGVDKGAIAWVGLGYLIFVLYTWIGMPILRRWTRWFPLR